MTDTKTQIITIATNLILEKGFNAFSYADISKVLNIKNAAVHYHFPTKEDLGVAVMKMQQENLKNFIETLQKNKVEEIAQLKALFSIYSGLFYEKRICALGSMGSDIQTLSPKIQTEVKKDYEQVLDWVEELLKSGKEKKIFRFDATPRIKAELIMNHLIAGVIVARFNETEKGHFEEILEEALADIVLK